ncbi:tripartite tricarboxylate transporter substrate binding protein [Tropicimonas sediminicola]|uniref:Tripartite-type tricarboxylate transporter, receptor component TctC n=1 Tax=Tropicimonas sediminicola TaxID=1031541 RepID=A0A239EH92_9RHOB|nr:tripartite tricarboxylate transporter substrate binding protein [Tropicimonas sediminicola]SNS43939.1 Tripartite-type tricarboxylate transporter, receptor component TctC [Tropicimonas sediminicola]
MTTTHLTRLLGATALGFGAVLATQAAAECDWKPERAVTYIVPWGAGGGTDANSRMLASLLSQEFGVPFNVVNRTGGNGVTGHSAIARAEPDGYTVGAVTVEINTMHWVGLTDLTHEDITPIALVDVVPAGFTVKADSEFGSVTEVLEYAKANPGELTASGTSQGGIWHLALAGLLNAEGMDPEAIRWIPSQGAGPAMQELMAGGVDVVTVAQSEAKTLIEQGELKGLGYMHTERMAALPDIPTTAEELPSGWTLAANITLSGPGGMDPEIACSYEKAALKVMDTQEWADFKASRGADVVLMGSEDLAALMVKNDQALGDTIKAIGMAK